MIDLLYQLLRIESFDELGKAQCADVLAKELASIGFKTKLITDKGAPVLIANYDTTSNSNVLFYSHYDVKPAGDIRKWNTDPFEPYYDEKSQKIYARGSGDAKGQIYCIIEGIREYVNTVSLKKTNITILLEGDEESNSPSLYTICQKYLSSIKYDLVLMIDSHWIGNQPLICSGTRGQVSMKLTYQDSNIKESLHAGNYGGIYQGAAYFLLIKLQKLLQNIIGEYKLNEKTDHTFGDVVSLTYLNGGDINRSLIPHICKARLDLRYTEQFNIEDVLSYIQCYCQKNRILLQLEQNEKGAYSEPSVYYTKILNEALIKSTGIIPKIEPYCGAYLPMDKLRHISGIKYIVPFAQCDEHNHAPNENILVNHLQYGIDFIFCILQKITY